MKHWSENDIGDQSGRVALITGGNSGIGFEAARALLQHGAHVVLACRSPQRAREAEGRLTALAPAGSVEVLIMELGDLESVADAAHRFGSTHDRLDLLVNNAGVMATPRGTTAQGLETQIGVNHLSHFALTAHLLTHLVETDASRIVSVTSVGHRVGRINFDDLHSHRRYSPWPAYVQSKLANLLFVLELQRRLDAVGSSTLALAAHPGISRTHLGHENPGDLLNTVLYRARLFTDRFMQSAAMGALPTLRAATDADAQGGDYFGPDGFAELRGHPVKVSRSARARDPLAARRLWEISVEATGADFGLLNAVRQ